MVFVTNAVVAAAAIIIIVVIIIIVIIIVVVIFHFLHCNHHHPFHFVRTILVLPHTIYVLCTHICVCHWIVWHFVIYVSHCHPVCVCVYARLKDFEYTPHIHHCNAKRQIDANTHPYTLTNSYIQLSR